MSRSSWTYLVITGLVAGAAVVTVVAPGTLASLAGPARPPQGLGSDPLVVGTVGGELAAQESRAALAGVGSVSLAPTVAAAPKEPEKTVERPIVEAKPTFPDEQKAVVILADAEAAYRALNWDKAESAARRIGSMRATPQLRDRAKDIENGAPKLRVLFKDLNDREELQRGWDTHPSLVRIDQTLAIPIRSMDDIDPILDNPVGWIEAQRGAGRVALLIQGKKDFIPGVLERIGTVEKVDEKAIIATRATELDGRLATLRGDPGRARSATSWYEVGRFAYRNRLDTKVTDLLDRALSIDPLLNRTVREASAQALMANMIAHLKNGNRKQAESFMASIVRRFKDTQAAAEAMAYLNDDKKKIIAMARQTEEAEKLQEEERRAERLRLAKEKEDKSALAQVEQEEAEARKAKEEEAAAPAADPNVPADIAKADALSADGYKPYSAAMQMGPTAERNKLYHDAAAIFEKALKIYDAYLAKHPDDEAIMTKRLETNKMRFAAKKYQTL